MTCIDVLHKCRKSSAPESTKSDQSLHASCQFGCIWIRAFAVTASSAAPGLECLRKGLLLLRRQQPGWPVLHKTPGIPSKRSMCLADAPRAASGERRAARGERKQWQPDSLAALLSGKAHLVAPFFLGCIQGPVRPVNERGG